ncbi:centromere kinetochore component CENP-T-domain-containing protein [Lineolata rhizophorae]|uniref:Centromere kinetochore component CENP-T-domain-containing protein n=1 Tax=Lineolata rhizophorae TaxID=578093 RepID=A0A6A6P8D2_9PEZI|nr:centromere kinetochore component CENP-T-domain-containing protein [Lineolata rhizophorae]
MTGPRQKRPRVTPRNSGADDALQKENPTPYADLKMLASIARPPSTPAAGFRPSSSTSKGPTPNSRPGGSARLTPSSQHRSAATTTPRQPLFPVPSHRRAATKPTTPHAIRAHQLRQQLQAQRYGQTPGQRERRRLSAARLQRDTPRDVLRNLSRVLMEKSAPTALTPQEHQQQSEARRRRRRGSAAGDDDDGPDIVPPRLSMPLHDDDDSFHEAPPRLSMGLEDDPGTGNSVEGGRRARDWMPSRLSRGSFGSVRVEDVTDMGINVGEEEGPEAALEDVTQDLIGGETGNLLIDDNTQELRSFMEVAGRRQSRQSDVDVGGPGDESEMEPTFHFTVPQRPMPTLEPINQVPFEEEPPTPVVADESILPTVTEDEVDYGGVASEVEEPVAQEPTLRVDPELAAIEAERQKELRANQKRPVRQKRISKHGIEYPLLPSSVVRKLATSMIRSSGSSNAKLSKDTLDAIMQATDWFFEQASEDLGKYAQHAGRKTIDESDVITLMKRHC